MKKNTPFRTKQKFKRLYNKCAICDENDYTLLDTHRWRQEGGRYSNDNCICICTKCHRLVHDKKIIILGIHNSSVGRVVRYKNKEGEEKFNIL